MSSYNVGIIGLGGMGERFWPVFDKHPGTNLVAVCETDPGKRDKFREQAPAVEMYANYHELLQNPGVDLVYVAVPPMLHYPIVMEALRQGKHIFCEKPLANSIAEAKEMATAAELANVVHAINFPTVYRNVFKKLSTLNSAGYIGELRRIEVLAYFHTWPRAWQRNSWVASREQGGFVREVMPHYIQMIQQLFGRTKHVHSMLQYPPEQSACENNFVGYLEVEKGAPVLLSGVSNLARKESISMTLYGDMGTLSLVDWNTLMGGRFGEELTRIEAEENNHLFELVTELVKAMNGDKADVVDFRQGYEVQQVLEQLLAFGWEKDRKKQIED